MCVDIWSTTGAWANYQSCIPKETESPFPSSHQWLLACHPGVWLSELLPSPCQNSGWLDVVQVLFMLCRHWVSMFNDSVKSGNSFFHSSQLQALDLTNFLASVLMTPTHLKMGYNITIPFKTEQLCLIVCVFFFNQSESLYQLPSTTKRNFSYEGCMLHHSIWRHIKYLETGLILSPLSRIIAVGSSLKPRAYSTIDSWPG